VCGQDGEPDDRLLPGGDERVRVFREVSGPRRPPGAPAALASAEKEALVADLRLRGFGWLSPERIARRLEPMMSRRTGFWDEVLRPRPREPAPPPRVLRERPRFRWEYLGLAAAAV